MSFTGVYDGLDAPRIWTAPRPYTCTLAESFPPSAVRTLYEIGRNRARKHTESKLALTFISKDLASQKPQYNANSRRPTVKRKYLTTFTKLLIRMIIFINFSLVAICKQILDFSMNVIQREAQGMPFKCETFASKN